MGTTTLFRILAKINRIFLPSFTKSRLDLAQAKKWQLALIGWKYYVTCRAVDQ
ncbi:SsrA-binding protein [Sediminicola luteus]|uniref:SsrA-binding protein n=1 Tax=Sediminicola luteus TaxID=319238 RepID=A0A2A4G9C3_9FLAO|nr:SsrA-binding protein [Sediminicola luteus]PCE64355.1 SsrA-binding protein [Sediminicola luteus]